MDVALDRSPDSDAPSRRLPPNRSPLDGDGDAAAMREPMAWAVGKPVTVEIFVLPAGQPSARLEVRFTDRPADAARRDACTATLRDAQENVVAQPRRRTMS